MLQDLYSPGRRRAHDSTARLFPGVDQSLFDFLYDVSYIRRLLMARTKERHLWSGRRLCLGVPLPYGSLVTVLEMCKLYILYSLGTKGSDYTKSRLHLWTVQ